MTDSPPKPKRRWFQFSMRSLMVLLVACAVFCGWRVYRARTNRERVAAVEKAVDEFEKLGGYTQSHYELQARSATWLEELFDDPGGPDDPCDIGVILRVLIYSSRSPGFGDDRNVTDALVHLENMTTLEVLRLTDCYVTDAGLEHLKGLTNLEELALTNTKVTDAGLKHLKGLTDLETLSIEDTRITDAGLEHLKGLTKLEDLRLGASYYNLDTQVTDAGLEHLKGLTNLEYLKIWSTKVTDAGLQHLRGLTNLKELCLVHTKVTDAGVAKLQQALPNCKIIR